MASGIKQDWRHVQIQLLAQTKELWSKFRGQLLRIAPTAGGFSGDLYFRTHEAVYITEIKAVSSGAYLSFATLGQMHQMRMYEWGPVICVPILFTNAQLSKNLRATFEEVRIPVIEVEVGEDVGTTHQKLTSALKYLKLPVPELEVGLGYGQEQST